MRTPAEQAEWNRVHAAMNQLEAAVDKQVALVAKVTLSEAKIADVESQINAIFSRNTNITGKPYQPEHKYKHACKDVLQTIGVDPDSVNWDRIGRAYNDFVPVSRAVAVEALSSRDSKAEMQHA